jgi:hypothetical protein
VPSHVFAGHMRWRAPISRSRSPSAFLIELCAAMIVPWMAPVSMRVRSNETLVHGYTVR